MAMEGSQMDIDKPTDDDDGDDNNRKKQQQTTTSSSSSSSSSTNNNNDNNNTTTTTTTSLTGTQILYPKSKILGHGLTALKYNPLSPAWDCTFSSDGNWLAACYGAPDPCIRIWKLDDYAHNNNNNNNHNNPNQWIFHSTLTGVHDRTIRCVEFAPLSNNKTYILAAASFDASVSLWEYNNNNISADDDDSNDDYDTWECTTQLEGHENEVKCVTWNSTGSLLATCGRDKTVWLWETFLDDGSIGGSSDNDFECIAVLNGHEGDVKCVVFADSHGQWGDGDEIVCSAGYDDTIKIWAEDAGDWYCAMSISDGIHTDTIWSLAVSPGSTRLVSASADGSIAILKNYTVREKKDKFPDQAAGSNGLWKCVGKLPNAHASTIFSIAYAPIKAGHGRIASGGADNRIQIYREVVGSTSDKPKFALDVAVEITTNGIIVGTNNNNNNNGDKMTTNNTSGVGFGVGGGGGGDVNCVCWHPYDGNILCSAGDDGNVRLWKFST